MLLKWAVFALSIMLISCVSTEARDGSLYEDMGGRESIAEFLDVFVVELARDPYVSHHFRDTNVQRFKEKQIEHICLLADGPCEYTGDDMIAVHGGMNIDSATFNRTTEVMIEAMKKHGWGISIRNRLLARLAELRHEVIYQ